MMPIKPKPGHWYLTRRGEAVAYSGPNSGGFANTYPHMVSHRPYTDDGRYVNIPRTCHDNDVMVDIDTAFPRLQKPRKAPAKKFRKLRMWFYYDSDGDLCGLFRGRVFVQCRNHERYGPIFSQIINVPIPSPKKPKAKK